MKTKITLFLSFFISVLTFSLFSQSALSAVTLLDQNEWKVLLSGFVETDFIHDTTRSFGEVIGNNPVVSSPGRTQFSIRNSRLAFAVLAPVQDDWKSKGYFEFDLLGYNPAVSSTGTTNSEASYYTNPTLRVRHAYLNLEKNGWQILAGQSWTLFGWQPNYVPTTVSVPPMPGVIYQRTPELIVIKKLGLSDSENLQLGISMARPSQRDSELPNFDAGVRVSSSRRSSGFASPSGEVNLEPMSFALTGTRRDFVTPDSATALDEVTHHVGYAFALDVLMPVIAAGESAAGSLTWTAEFSQGHGDSDAFPGWSGNLSQLPTAGPGVSNSTNLDAGQGGFDSAGGFHLVNLQTWNTQLQYHLPTALRAFVTAGYSEIRSSNIGDLLPAAKTIYDRDSVWFVNFFHDCTKQIRVGLEYAQVKTHYIDGTQPLDQRYQASLYFRF